MAAARRRGAPEVAHYSSFADEKSGDSLAAVMGGGTADPAERLTAWLLEQTSPAGIS